MVLQLASVAEELAVWLVVGALSLAVAGVLVAGRGMSAARRLAERRRTA